MQPACVERALLRPKLKEFGPGALSESLFELVFDRIISKSVRILGRRTFGSTTPQASLNRRCGVFNF